jgi:hypothetical protein
MPTAPDGQVFIKWTKLSFVKDELTGNFDTLVNVIVNVAGQLISSQFTYVHAPDDDLSFVLPAALELKRNEYVSA